MNIIFRVDSSLKIGLGHLMRCLTLAQALKENGSEVKFICRKHEGSLIEKVRSSGFIAYELEAFKETQVDTKLAHSNWLGVTQQKDADDCIEILKLEKVDWLIVDHYALDELWQKRLKPYYEKLMVIDDLADRKHQCDILLDQTFGCQQEDYLELIPKRCKLLLGSQYALLRPEFNKWRSYSLKRRSKPEFKQLLINMGGIDKDNITEKVLDKLKRCNLPKELKIIIVMGKFAPHLNNVKLTADTLPFKTKVKVDVGNLAEIMANSDIAIGAAGATSWERCCLGLSTIQIVIAKNQRTISENLAKINAIRLLKNLEELPGVINDYNIWIEDVNKVNRLVTDGLGSNKVTSAIFKK